MILGLLSRSANIFVKEKKEKKKSDTWHPLFSCKYFLNKKGNPIHWLLQSPPAIFSDAGSLHLLYKACSLYTCPTLSPARLCGRSRDIH